MGGYGSGRRCSSKDTTSSYIQLDVRWLQRKGFLRPGYDFTLTWSRNGEIFANINIRSESDRIILIYRHRKYNEDDWQSREYPVLLEWRRCNYGGQRAWFVCPGLGCGRRVAILYGGRIFACRHCYQLAYASQRETVNDCACVRRRESA